MDKHNTKRTLSLLNVEMFAELGYSTEQLFAELGLTTELLTRMNKLNCPSPPLLKISQVPQQLSH